MNKISFVESIVDSQGKYLSQSSEEYKFKYGFAKIEIYSDLSGDSAAFIEMLAILEEINSNIETAWEYVYSHYLRFCKFEKWMNDLGIPIALKMNEINRYVSCISVTGYRADGLWDEVVLFFRVDWDVEHCIYLKWSENKTWIKVDG